MLTLARPTVTLKQFEDHFFVSRYKVVTESSWIT